MLGKIFAGFVGARVAEQSGKSGLLGMASGLVISRIARRSPMGALVVGGAWLGHKLYQRNKEHQFDRAARNARPVAPAGPVKTPVDKSAAKRGAARRAAGAAAGPKEGAAGGGPTLSPSAAPSSDS
ncbi:MAG: hypothetical protein AB7E05_10310 [Sphingobium sp.]